MSFVNCKYCGAQIIDDFEVCYDCKKFGQKSKPLDDDYLDYDKIIEKALSNSESIKGNYLYSDCKFSYEIEEEFMNKTLWSRSFEYTGDFLHYKKTWDSKKMSHYQEVLKNKIRVGEFKVYYIDLVKKMVDRLKKEAEKPYSFFGISYSKSKKIDKVNLYFRGLAYYNALIELGINYYSIKNREQ